MNATFHCFYRSISTTDIMNHSYVWLLEKINNDYFESEMEIASIIIRWLEFHGESVRPFVIDLVIKSLSVTSLKEYFIKQILPRCTHFDMTKERIAAICNFQSNGTLSPLIHQEWMQPAHDTNPLGFNSDMVHVVNWCPVDMKKYPFFENKHPGVVHESPVFVNFLGVTMVPKLTFHTPNIILKMKAVFCNGNDEKTIQVDKLNCEFAAYFRKGNREQKYSGVFCDSVVSLSFNIMEWKDSDPFAYFEYLKELNVLFSVKRFA